MSRSGYTEDVYDPLIVGRWRGAVRSAMSGKRGQAFLREALAALDAMPDKRLIRNHLRIDGSQDGYGAADFIVGGDELIDARSGTIAPMGAVCMLGAVGRSRGMKMDDLDPDDSETIAGAFGIAHAMACEIMYWNDEDDSRETPEHRWVRMRGWIQRHIIDDNTLHTNKERDDLFT